MGAITGMLGLGGGEAGTGVSFQEAYTPEQMRQSYQSSQEALAQQQRLLDAVAQQQQALAGQGGLANQAQVYKQLQDVIAGRGANPAQAMLAQAAGQNVAQQAALMAGQRGAGSNVGLMARQAGRQGADIQQQAAQQAAILQAQQSLGALGQAQGLAGQQVAQQLAGMQQQMGATGAITGAQLQQQQNIADAIARQNAARAGIAQERTRGQSQLIGGLLGGGAQAGMQAAMAADGGMISNIPQTSATGPQSSVGRYLQGFAQGGDVGTALKTGGHVPGTAHYKGDNLKNDTVHAMLSPGEIVIPRSVAMSKNAPKKSAEFVAAVLAQKGIRS